MLKRTGALLVPVLLLSVTGCALLGGGGLKPGEAVEGDLDAGMEIGEIIPDAEEVLLAAGIAVEDDWAAVQFPLAAGDEGISLFVEADDIDPVIVVVDADLNVITAGDDWDEELDAFVSLDMVPEGAFAVVFDATGDEGLFTVETDEFERYEWMLLPGETINSYILEDKNNELWEDLVTEFDEIYYEDWETCAVIPMTIDEDGWIRVKAMGDDDLIMVICKVDNGELIFTDYDDDTYGMDPGFIGEVSEGSYVALVNAYYGGLDSEFSISLDMVDMEEMRADIVQADQMNQWFTGEFREGALVMSYWPEAGDYWGITPEEHAVVFEFRIDEHGQYTFDATSSIDTKMAIIDDGGLIDYNDDGPEGLDPQLTLELAPGNYAAVVTPFSGDVNEEVDFRFSMAGGPVERERGYVPWDETRWSDSNIYLSLVFNPGETYEIFAESDTDLTLTVTDRAGEEYFSDDDGGNFNPWLEIEATNENAGAWEIDVESYGGYGIGDEVRVVARPVSSGSTSSSTSIKVDL
ncbi:hypothetical protein CSA37_01370 [Candidatus Fermentibacteria bacterium]|nr:MAG: hypothetical protein CSA37_01370 [Candidatus Fermentibacteria bacterium]